MTLKDTLSLIKAGYTKQDIDAMEGGAATPPITKTPPVEAAIKPAAPPSNTPSTPNTPKTYTAEEVLELIKMTQEQAPKTQKQTESPKQPELPTPVPSDQMQALLDSLRGIELPPTTNLSDKLADHYNTLRYGERKEA